MIGSSFVVGIVVGSLTLTRLGDIYGRKPTYMGGLWMHLTFTISLLLVTNTYLLFGLMFYFGASATAKYYVGFNYLNEI